MSDVRTILTENLNELVRRKGIKSIELAEQLGVSKSAVSHWLAGDNSPNIELLAKICQIYGVKLSEMLNEKIETSYIEKELLKKYRSLDKRGKGTVEAVLDIEYRNCESQNNEIHTTPAIRAARSFGNVSKIDRNADIDEQKFIDAPENDIDM